jgi:ABC-type transport system involved in multi-copper enzyme maturation permease subunit
MGVSVPVAALGLLLGAIDLPTLAGLYLAHAVMGLALLSLGLAVSTLFGRTWTAGLVSVGLVLALATLGSTLSATLAALLAPERLEAYRPLAFLPMAFTPFYGTVLFLSGSMFEAWSGFPWAEHLLAMGAIAVLALGFAARRIGEARD